MMKSKLEIAYSNCEKIINHHSKTFSRAFKRLPKEKAQAVFSIYAFNRLLDDICDESNDIKQLDVEYENFNKMLDNDVIDTDIYLTLYDVFTNYQMSPEPFYAMFKGQYQDLAFSEIKDDEMLLDYAYLVAGSVGHMLLPIVASENKDQLYESAKALGQAMQITNILRDIKEDYLDKQRVYLSSATLKKFKVDLSDIISNGITNEYIAMWEYYAHMAEDLYASALTDIKLYDKDSQVVVMGAALLYRAILDEVRKQNYDINKRAVVSKSKKLAVLKELTILK